MAAWMGVAGQAMAVEFCPSDPSIPQASVPRGATVQASRCPLEPEEPVPAARDSQFLSQSVPTQMVVGQTYPVTVSLKNTGTAIWKAADGFRLGSQNPGDNTTWGFHRVDPPDEIASGQTANFDFDVHAPMAAGTYNFQWRMVQDGVAWFGAITTNVKVTVLASLVTGRVDDITNGYLSGWACSTHLESPIDVHVYVGGAAGAGGTFVGSFRADRDNEAGVAQSCAAGGGHRFWIDLAPFVAQYAGKKIYVHGISPVGAANPAIAQSGVYAVPANRPPSVQLTAPGNGASVATLAPLHLAASASDPDDGVAGVEFQVDGQSVATVGAAPYEYIVSGLGVGSHSVRAIVRDTRGASAASATATVDVRPAAPGDPGVATVFSTSTEYDELGRVIAQRGNNGQEYRYEYDQEGRRTASVDAPGRRTAMAYDARGRLVAVTDSAGQVTRFAYDQADRIVQVTDPRGKATAYDYDGFGQLWRQVSPDTGATAFAYDGAGQRTSMIRADGVVTQYSYDGLGRVTGIVAGDQQQLFVYDACTNGKGRLCEAHGPSDAVLLGYTPQGALATRTDRIRFGAAMEQLDSAYAYDGLGRLSSIAYPSGLTVGYGYRDGRLSALSTSRDGAVGHVVDAVEYAAMSAAPTRVAYGNGLVKEIDYDQDLRMSGFAVKAGSAVVQQLDYGYSTADEITRIADAVNTALTQDIAYDPLGRLSELQRNGATHRMAYDANGNWTVYEEGNGVRSYDIDADSNRLLGYASTDPGDMGRQYGYDALGNRTSERASGDERSYGYSPFNRLAWVVVNGSRTDYVVNALGQRVGKSNAAGARQYTYLGQNQLLSERAPDGGWTDYLWLGGELVGVVRGGQTYWVHTDHLGRPEVASDANRVVVWKAYNYAYGRTVQQDDMGGLPLGFPGQYQDAETGLWYNGFRDYDPGIGRYLESDPIGLEAGANTYAYVSGNPVSLVDPSGLEGVGPWTFPPGPQRDAYMAAQNGARGPDFFQLSVSVYVFGGSVTLSRSGNVFVSGGIGRAYPNPVRGLGASLNAGNLMSSCPVAKERGAKTDKFLTGLGYSATAHDIIGGGAAYSPGSGGAVLYGVGAGVEVSPGSVGAQTPWSLPGW
ncbi:RHS repeat-associated core domain-containing protein [Xanthomonas massiliensis]|uniref:RHS repeat-associated core domain-containing protein n=1 Tax=Xanthomonas massiliensis TaxID=1720302 RepID=UPI001C9CC6E9|nr:RHS repeat-associated core domain-containing protein [Xanthomonas massiliensis]